MFRLLFFCRVFSVPCTHAGMGAPASSSVHCSDKRTFSSRRARSFSCHTCHMRRPMALQQRQHRPHSHRCYVHRLKGSLSLSSPLSLSASSFFLFKASLFAFILSRLLLIFSALRSPPRRRNPAATAKWVCVQLTGGPVGFNRALQRHRYLCLSGTEWSGQFHHSVRYRLLGLRYHFQGSLSLSVSLRLADVSLTLQTLGQLLLRREKQLQREVLRRLLDLFTLKRPHCVLTTPVGSLSLLSSLFRCSTAGAFSCKASSLEACEQLRSRAVRVFRVFSGNLLGAVCNMQKAHLLRGVVGGSVP